MFMMATLGKVLLGSSKLRKRTNWFKCRNGGTMSKTATELLNMPTSIRNGLPTKIKMKKARLAQTSDPEIKKNKN